jgi:hypothetical protein
VHGHLTALAEIVLVGVALIADVLQREAAIHEHAGLAVLTKDHVVGGERGSTADVRRILAIGGHVE